MIVEKYRAWDKELKMMSAPIMPFKEGLFFFFFEGVGSRAAFNKSLDVMRYAGFKVKDDTEVYRGDYIKATLPEAINKVGHNEDDCLVPKVVIGEVRINPKSGARLLVRKVSGCEDDGIQVGGYLKIKKQDEVIGNKYENQELLIKG